jgi:hypothetical protein
MSIPVNDYVSIIEDKMSGRHVPGWLDVDTDRDRRERRERERERRIIGDFICVIVE